MDTSRFVSLFVTAAFLASMALACSASSDTEDPTVTGATGEGATGADEEELRANACATVRCTSNTHCVLQKVVCVRAPCPKIAKCVADECTTDSDCHAANDYCTGCNCRALASGESLAACTGPGVRCKRAPCDGKKAECSNGACVIR